MSVLKAHIFRAVNPAFASVTVGIISAFLVFRNYQEGRGLYLIKRWDDDTRKKNKENNNATKEEFSVYDYLIDNEGFVTKPSMYSEHTESLLPQHFEEHISNLDRPVLIYDYVFAFEESNSVHDVSMHESALSHHIHTWTGHA